MPRSENEVPSDAKPPQVVIMGIPVPIFLCILVGSIVLMNVLKLFLPDLLAFILGGLTFWVVGERFRLRD